MQAGTCGEDWDEDREGEKDDPTDGETPNKDATVRSPIPARGKLTILQDTSHSDGREQQANAAGPVGAAAELLNSMRHDPARRHSRLQGSGFTTDVITGTTTAHQALPKAGHGARARYSICTGFIDCLTFPGAAGA